jgi:uncharacterized membrane protein YcaP (DUF421 family)
VRLSGKREVGRMTPFDLTQLLLSNSVQNAMTGPDTSLIGGVVAASTLLLLNLKVDGSISCLKYDEMKPYGNNHLVRRRFIQEK